MNHVNKVIALLPMKGNSERVPNKNLKIFNGIPLFHWVLIELLKSKYIDEIVINTDSDLIKKNIYDNFDSKIKVIDRPKEIIGDFVSMNEIIACDISQTDGYIYLQTHSTNPLLTVNSIDNALEKMNSNSNQFDSIFSVTKLQTRLYDSQGVPLNHNPNNLVRTQDLAPIFEENSNFFIFSKESFERAGNKRIGIKPLMFEIDKLEAMDIDEPQDFTIAESVHKLIR